MAFSSSVKKKAQAGSFRLTTGTWDAAAVITGNIDTGIGYLYSIDIQERGSATEALAARSGVFVDETLPGAIGHAVTIHCKANSSGVFIAIGR